MRSLRCQGIALVLAISLLGALPALVQAAAPKTGSWVEYAITTKGIPKAGDEKHKTVKISIVGTEKVDGKEYTWFEFTSTESGETTITKLLAAYKDPSPTSDGYGFWSDTKKLILQRKGQEPEEASPQSIARYEPQLVEAFQGLNRRASENLEPPKLADKADEKISVGKESLACKVKTETKKQRSKVNLGFIMLEDLSTIEAEYALNPKVPITGYARLNAKVETASTTQRPNQDASKRGPRSTETKLTCTGFGMKGAKSEITAKPVPMKENPLPFLQPKK